MRRMIYFPSRYSPSLRESGLRGAENVSFRSDDGLTLGAWFVSPACPAEARSSSSPGERRRACPAEARSSSSPGERRRACPAEARSSSSPGERRREVVIVFNGNAGNRGMRAPLAAALAERGMAVLLTDYRGYGGNPGSPSEQGLFRDARAALAYVAARRDVDRSRIVYFGESLGTAVAAALATEHPPHALVLRSPFTSLLDIGRHHYPFLPVGLVLRDRFDTLSRIRQIACPLLVIGGDRDGIIPISSTRTVYEAAPEPKQLLVLSNIDHNDWELLAGKQMIDTIVKFVRA
jgi:fermentation-respiration switch protein FrsA (DUF1100 family)